MKVRLSTQTPDDKTFDYISLGSLYTVKTPLHCDMKGVNSTVARVFSETSRIIEGVNIFWQSNISEKCVSFEICKGFDWDGATGVPDTRRILVPSLVHDALYGAISIICADIRHEPHRRTLRRFADEVFINLCKQYKIPAYSRAVLWAGLRLFGRRHTFPRPRMQRKTLRLP